MGVFETEGLQIMLVFAFSTVWQDGRELITGRRESSGVGHVTLVQMLLADDQKRLQLCQLWQNRASLIYPYYWATPR